MFVASSISIQIEPAFAEELPEPSSSCLCASKRTWKKIVFGTTGTMGLGSMTMLIYGAVIQNKFIADIGVLSFVASSGICLIGYLATSEKPKRPDGMRTISSSQVRQV